MSHFRLKLFFILLIFAIGISFTLTTVNHNHVKKRVIAYNTLQVKQIEEAIQESLETTEKIYYFFDQDTTTTLAENTELLLELYSDNPDFEHWDFAQLKNDLGSDIYIINEQNTIIHSSIQSEVGLNFTQCCQKLAKILDERRNAGGFHSDGMDIEQETGKIKKYSYTATPDKKYIIELSVSLEDRLVFKEFNFLKIKNELIDYYPSLNEINILHYAGFSFDGPLEDRKLQEERRDAFEQTYASKQDTTLDGLWNGKPASYHYVHYKSKYDTGATQDKVLEIIFNEDELQGWLNRTKSSFLIELFLSLILSIILSAIIARWTAKPFHLAFHDSLTGLKNRAALDEQFQLLNSDGPHTNAYLLIDLDHFKEVNDRLGHDEGDRLLKHVAQLIQSTVKDVGNTFRLGGDEFVVIMPFTNKDEVIKTAQAIAYSFRHRLINKYKKQKIDVTASIGISLSPEHGNIPSELLKKADLALYHSKEQGKNQFYFYHDNLAQSDREPISENK